MFFNRINRRKTHYLQEKDRSRQEGREYRRLAEKSALENFELANIQKAKQKDIKNMYDKTVEDRRKVKEMERQMDEVSFHDNIFL